jgi:peptidoglycan/xylan/chitin deacetylase (PgdA/CDA1 family)
VYFNNLEPLFSIIYPKLTWKRKSKEKVIYLTFDDGPVPEVTDFVLNLLSEYKAKATFFCVVENITKNPDVFKKIIAQGHKIGNHTYNHLNGWKNENDTYVENTTKADKVILENIATENVYRSSFSGKKLFRPPYGKIRKAQMNALLDEYEIIMWDVLTGDFDKNLAPENCLKKSIRYTKKGSIVIFHDSAKALPNLKIALPGFLKHFTDKSYRFETL